MRATDGELLATVVYGEPQPTRTVSEPAFASDGSGKVRLFVPTHFGLFTYLLHE